MPTNFPPLHCQCGELAGMGTPDMRGTYGTFTFYTDDPFQAGGELAGGQIVHVHAAGPDLVLPLEGPANSLRKDRRRTSVAMVVHLDRAQRAARIELDGRRLVLREGEWSDWIRVKFPLIPGIAGATGIVRLF